MMRKTALAGLVLATTGCMTAANSGAEEATPPRHGGDWAERCDAAAAQSLVGQEASSALAAEAQRLTGARTVRWLQPGQIVTMEYRAGRLNIHLDARNRVESFACG